MRKFLKFLLVVFLLAVLAGLIWLLVWWKGWPWWVGAAVFVGVVGLWLAFKFVKTYYFRRKEREFVRRVIAQDDASIRGAPAHDRQTLKELQVHWKDSIELLKGSYLRKQGNPLYVLPWFVVIGESGAGKSSAVRNAGLSSPMTDIDRTAGLAATRNCDWWFFEQAVVLDTAGRYTVPIDEGPDREEWARFLTLLTQYRRKEPVNGVIVVVSADQILSGNEQKLREDGMDVRRRVDNLMRSLGSKSPVYILVTKMDLVHGMSAFCGHLPPESLNQAMGFTNRKENPYWREVLDTSFQDVSSRLRELRSAITHSVRETDPGVLMFPNEFEKMKPGLAAFVQPVFDENPYQETPPFRGLFFSSSRQGAPPHSEFLKTFGLDQRGGVPEAADNGVFLKNFFSQILPRDRFFFTPIREFLQWKRLTRNLGMLSWFLVSAALIGVLSLSFHQNRKVIQGFTDSFYFPPQISGDLAADLIMLDRLRVEVLEMRKSNRSWWIPRVGLTQSLRLQQKVQGHFVRLFREGYLIPLDNSWRDRIDQVRADTPEDMIVDYAGYLATRIALIQNWLSGDAHEDDDPPPIMVEFRRATSDLITTDYPNIPSEISSKFGDIYYTYLFLYGDRFERETKLRELRQMLVDLLEHKGHSLNWLVRKWIPDAPDITLTDFWGAPETPYDPAAAVPGAFTKKGRQNIADFIRLLESALQSTQTLATRKAEFWDWYQGQFYEAWLRLTHHFSDGANAQPGRPQQQQLASTMATPQNPYFEYISRMADELRCLGDQAPPNWAVLVQELDSAVREADRQRQAKNAQAGIVDKLKQEGQTALKKAESQIDPESARREEKTIACGQAWNDYADALQSLGSLAVSRQNCYKMLASFFPEDLSAPPAQPAAVPQPTPKEGFNTTMEHSVRLASMMVESSYSPFIWDLVEGPFSFLLDFALKETSCLLQDEWGRQVLGGIQGAEDDKLTKVLFNKQDGLVWKYVNGTAKPFITASQNGYQAAVISDRAIPFDPAFFNFLSKGGEGVVNYQKEYIVQLEAVPLESNPEASTKPYGATVCLQCADAKKYCLENYNYPQSTVFKWDQEACGDVVLTIQFPQLSLVKTYSGGMGFALFLQDFQTGSKTFTAKDFPESAAQFEEIGASWVKVVYKIGGADPVIKLLRRSPTRVPAQVVPCWSR